MNTEKNIVVTAFNRPEKLENVLSSLPKERVTVYIDGPRNESDAEGINKTIDICVKTGVTYVARERNAGLAKSVISAVNETLSLFETAIVVEDDVIVSPAGLRFLEAALDHYRDDEDVFQVGLYLPPHVSVPGETVRAVKIPRICSWGWGIWRDRWASIDWNCAQYSKSIFKAKELEFGGRDMKTMIINQLEGRPTGWVARADFNRALLRRVCIYPTIGLTKNIGTDGSGVNTPKTDRYDLNAPIDFKGDIEVDVVLEYDSIRNDFESFYTRNLKSDLVVMLRRLGLWK